MEELKKLYAETFGEGPDEVQPFPASGSDRHYYRLCGKDASVVGVVGTSVEENRAFFTISEQLLSKGVSVPAVIAVSSDFLNYLQEDLGDESLYDDLASGRRTGAYNEAEKVLLKRAVAALPKIQFEGIKGLDISVCYPESEFNSRMVDFDLNYFKYCFLKPSAVDFNEVRLQKDFDLFREDLLEIGPKAFMYRDFQARNVMIRDSWPWFIDFQGGRLGPVHYDLASFVWQARARYGTELRSELVKTYLEAAAPYMPEVSENFAQELRLFVLLRTLQVLGAYGYRGLFEGKRHFVESIPYAIDNLRELLQNGFPRYPYLQTVLTALVESGFACKSVCRGDESLEVEVNSFSFKKGVPVDLSGNGGGYVYDCRYIRNPGRYERYKNLTGRDAEVIAFIEADGEASAFLKNAYSQVDAHVDRFIERGFTHLQVNFGCTGGHHRSVYCAERLAEHLRARYDVKVILHHKELEAEGRY